VNGQSIKSVHGLRNPKSPGVPAPGLCLSAQELKDIPHETYHVAGEFYQSFKVVDLHMACTSFAAQVATARRG
jgi:hypothetical protein